MSTTTNFFTQLKPLLEKGLDFTFTVRAQGDNLIVGVRPDYGKVENENFKLIKPLLLTHPAEKLDEGFFETITQPMETYLDVAKQVETWTADVKTKGEKVKEEKSPSKSESKPKAKSKPDSKKTKPAPKAAATPKPDPNEKLKATLDDKLSKIKELALTDPAAVVTLATEGLKLISNKKDKQILEVKAEFSQQLKKANEALKILAETKKAEEKDAKNLAAATEIAIRGKKFFEEGEYQRALDAYRKAYAIKPLPAWSQDITTMEKAIEDEKAEKLEKLIQSLVTEADAQRKGLNFPAFAATWKKIKELKPDHPALATLRQAVEVVINEATTKQLLDN